MTSNRHGCYDPYEIRKSLEQSQNTIVGSRQERKMTLRMIDYTRQDRWQRMYTRRMTTWKWLRGDRERWRPKLNNNNDMTTVNNTEYDDNRKRCWQRTDGRKWWYDDRGRWRQKVTQRMMTTQQKLMTLWRRIIEHCDRKWCFFLKGAWPSLQELLWPKIDR